MKMTAKLLTCLCALLLFAGLTATAALAADQTAPTLVSTSPAAGTIGVPIGSPITLTFSEPIQIIAQTVWYNDDDPVSVRISELNVPMTASFDGNVVTLWPNAGSWGQADGTRLDVTVHVGAFSDLYGNQAMGKKTFSFYLKDEAQPDMVYHRPSDGERDVSTSTPMKLTYDEKLLTGDNYNAIQVTNNLGQKINIAKTIHDNVLTIAPADGAWDDNCGYTYTVTIPARALKDAAGNNTNRSYTTTFTTVDNKRPKLISVVPANGTRNVRLDTPFVLVFNEEICVDGNQSNYSLVSSNPEQDQAHSYGIYCYANTLTIYPYDSHVWNNGYSTTYTLSISGYEIADVSYNYVASDITTRFTTIGLLSAKPSAAKASPSGYNSIQLNWNGLPGTTNYEIWRSTSRDGTYTRAGITASTSFTNTGLATDKTYFFKVRACQAVDGVNYYSAWSDIVSAKPIPVPPSNVKAVATTPSSAKITWDKVTGATNYEVWRATSPTGTYARIGLTAATSFTNTGLTTNTTYYYKVRTYQAIGGKSYYSTWSAIVSAKPIPAPPGNVKATTMSSSSVKITWNTVTGAKNYEVWRATSPTGTYTRVGMTAATSFTNTGLTVNTTYYYKVRAYLSVGGKYCFSAWSAIVSAKPVPAPPGNVKATAVSSSSAKITWNTVAGAKNYEVWRATSPTGTYTRVGMTAATSFTNTGLTVNTTYYYKVRAYLSVGGKYCFSAWSAIVSAKPIPAPPGNVKATAVSSSSAKITWNMVAGAKNYEVWRATSPTGSYTRVGMTAATSFTNTGLTTNTTYYYKVRAYLSVGGKYCFSAWSAIVSAKP